MRVVFAEAREMPCRDDRERVGIMVEALADADTDGALPRVIRAHGCRNHLPTHPTEVNGETMIDYELGTSTDLATMPDLDFSGAGAAEAAGLVPLRHEVGPSRDGAVG